MKVYRFTIVAGGVDPNSDDFEDRFFEAGCDDATITLQKGAVMLDFTREAKNLSHAVGTAIQDVKRATRF